MAARKKIRPDVVMVPVVTIDEDAIYRRLGIDVDALRAATREEIRRLSDVKRWT